jgi:hypothetical protein
MKDLIETVRAILTQYDDGYTAKEECKQQLYGAVLLDASFADKQTLK